MPDAERWMKKQHDELRDAAITSLITQGSIALLVVGGAAAGFGWLIAGRVLTPLHRVTETARRIAGSPPPTAACTSASPFPARTTRSRSSPTPSTR